MAHRACVGATPSQPPSDGSIRQSRETFAWEFPSPPSQQQQLLQHPASSIHPSVCLGSSSPTRRSTDARRGRIIQVMPEHQSHFDNKYRE
ncbi:hypothetical protein NQZ68_020691 [Dissostichus eleginoides]|nr:hypothetical protein NQZ68_020691 [Dissostichus eleginoides]